MRKQTIKEHNRYFTSFINYNKVGLIIPFFKSACNPLKEITESVGAYKAVKDHFKSLLFNNDTTIIVVGDGTKPRTASIFWSESPCQIYSIDPRLSIKSKIYYPFRDRLTIYKSKMEDVKIKGNNVIVVSVHGHAPLESILHNITAKEMHMVEIPCCFPFKAVPCQRTESYIDYSIHSEKNLVNIYFNVGESNEFTAEI